MRTRKVIRDSVQSSDGLLKVHIFRCFQKISLILCNSDIIFRITFIIKGVIDLPLPEEELALPVAKKISPKSSDRVII